MAISRRQADEAISKAVRLDCSCFGPCYIKVIDSYTNPRLVAVFHDVTVVSPDGAREETVALSDLNWPKNQGADSVEDDVFARYPKPWRLHPDYPRPGFASDSDGVVIDANGKPVMWSSEWFCAEEGVLGAILDAVNKE